MLFKEDWAVIALLKRTGVRSYPPERRRTWRFWREASDEWIDFMIVREFFYQLSWGGRSAAIIDLDLANHLDFWSTRSVSRRMEALRKLGIVTRASRSDAKPVIDVPLDPLQRKSSFSDEIPPGGEAWQLTADAARTAQEKLKSRYDSSTEES